MARILPGKKVLMQLRLRGPCGKELHVGPGGHHGHTVLHHARQIGYYLALFHVLGLRRRIADDPRHPVPFDKFRVKLEPAALEGDRPEAAGQQAQAVGVIIGRLVDGDDELRLGQRHGIGAGLAIRATEQRAVPLVEGEPVVRAGHDVPQVPPAAVKLPEQLQRRHAVKRRIKD